MVAGQQGRPWLGRTHVPGTYIFLKYEHPVITLQCEKVGQVPGSQELIGSLVPGDSGITSEPGRLARQDDVVNWL